MAQYSIINRVATGAAKSYGGLDRLEHYIRKERREREARERADGTAPPTTPQAWIEAREELRRTITPDNMDRWIAPVRAREDGDDLILEAPDEFGAFWLTTRLDGQIRRALEHTGHGHRAVTYGVADEDAPPSAPDLLRFGPQRDHWGEYARERFAALGITPREGRTSDRYNSVYGDHLVLSATPSWFEQNPQALERWVEHSVVFAVHKFGEAQVLGYEIHREQHSLHLHVGILAVSPDGRLSAGWYKDGREAMERLASDYNTYLRDHGLLLDRGRNARLERAVAAAPAADQRRGLRADDVPLDEVLRRLEADRDPLNPRRWHIGDRLIDVDEDRHDFVEHAAHSSLPGHGAIDLVRRLRQERLVDDADGPAERDDPDSPIGHYRAAVGYLAAAHPGRVMPDGLAPPLVPHVPEPVPQPSYRYAKSVPFGRETPTSGPGQFILVGKANEVESVAATAGGWGRVAAATDPALLPVDDLDRAVLGRGFTVTVLTRDRAVQEAIEARYPDQARAGRITFADPGGTQGQDLAEPLPRIGRAGGTPEPPASGPVTPPSARWPDRAPESEPAMAADFGTPSRWEDGALHLVDSAAELQAVVRSTTLGWGRVAVARQAAEVPRDEVSAALNRGWAVDVHSRDPGVLEAVREHVATRGHAEGRVWGQPPIAAKAKGMERAAEKAMHSETPDIGPEMMMGL